MSNQWYERRHELEPGMVFSSIFGLVKLDQRTEGDGTQWNVFDWNESFGYWMDQCSCIEPGDLRGEPIPDPTATPKA